jgi:hypothetical protein
MLRINEAKIGSSTGDVISGLQSCKLRLPQKVLVSRKLTISATFQRNIERKVESVSKNVFVAVCNCSRTQL